MRRIQQPNEGFSNGDFIMFLRFGLAGGLLLLSTACYIYSRAVTDTRDSRQLLSFIPCEETSLLNFFMFLRFSGSIIPDPLM